MKAKQCLDFKITGMNCSACSAAVERAAKSVQGVKSAVCSLVAGNLSVSGEYDSEEIITAVKKTGYGIEIKTDSNSIGAEYKKQAKAAAKRLIVSASILIVLMYISMSEMLNLPHPVGLNAKKILVGAQCALSLIIIAINNKFFRSGFKGLFKGAPNMDTLVSLGSLASLGVSIYGLTNVMLAASEEAAMLSDKYLFFDSAAMILVLVTVGKTLEAISKSKTTSALDSLVSLRPLEAVLTDGRLISVSELKVGDEFRVNAGESIPADGEIISGDGAVNESMITGESIPRDVRQGDFVTGATLLCSGHIIVKTKNTSESSILSEIIRSVESASATKAPIGRLADRLSGVFVWIIMAIALLTFGIWLIVSSFDAGTSIIFAASVLVISCPCALGIATPVAVVVGVGRAARQGVLIKDAAALETAGSINAIVFDKTGTITTGNIKVTGVEGDLSLAPMICGLEKCSSHPVAQSIVRWGEENGVTALDAVDFKSFYGGASAVIDGAIVRAGRASEFNAEETKAFASEIEKKHEGKSVIIGSDGKRNIAFVLEDEIKSTAVEAIDYFKQNKIKTFLFTGDSLAAGSRIAKVAGIEECRAALSPSQKAEEIRKLKETGCIVAFVGDGINDAVALTEADIGIAIGNGTDIAMDAAGAVLMSPDILKTSVLIQLSKKSGRIIKQNLFWAFFYNIICIPIAAGCFSALGLIATPMISAAAMSLSSVFVVLNSLRIDYNKKEKKTESVSKETEAEEHMKTVKIEGMMCMHCVSRVKQAFKDKGIDAEVDLESGTCRLNEDIQVEVIKEIVEQAGYKLGE